MNSKKDYEIYLISFLELTGQLDRLIEAGVYIMQNTTYCVSRK